MKKRLIFLYFAVLMGVLTPWAATAQFGNVSMVSDAWRPGKPGESFYFTAQVGNTGQTESGQTVTFSVSPDDGTASLSSTSGTTDSNGQVSTALTLGSNASGSYTVTASHGTDSVSQTVTVETSSPPSPKLSMVMTTSPWPIKPGDGQAFTVEVKEDGTTPSVGHSVSWSVSPDDGTASLTSTSGTTDSNGQAQTSLITTSSASGTYTVTASVNGLSVSSTADVEPPDPEPEPDPDPDPEPESQLSIVVISGLGSGAPGDGLTFVVEVRSDGSAASGHSVSFSVSPTDGTASLSPASATTGSNGRASTTLTLGSSASGSYTVTASVGAESVSGTATVKKPPPESQLSIVVISSLGSGAPGDGLTFVVEVRSDGSAASGHSVSFSVNPVAGASLSPTSATTGSNGRAQTKLVLGSSASGSYTVTASVGAESVSGTATVKKPPPPPELSIVAISSPGSGKPGDRLTFTVEVREDGSAASGQTVSFSVRPDAGPKPLSSTSATTGSNGRASTTLTLPSDASGTYTVSASVSNGPSLSWTVTVDTSSDDKPSASFSMVMLTSPWPGKPGGSFPFTVEVQEDGSPAQGQAVSFSVSPADGTASLSSTSATTGSDGQVQTTLVFGISASGTYTVTATLDNGLSVSGTATVDTSESEPKQDSEPNTDSVDGGQPEQDPEPGLEEINAENDLPSSQVGGGSIGDSGVVGGVPSRAEPPVLLEGISSSHDSVREDDGQATTIALTVTLDKAAGVGGEKVALTLVSPTQYKTAKHGEDFEATLANTLTIAQGHRTGTAQLILTPKDNATADGDKALGVQATSSGGHVALINIKIIDDEQADDEMTFDFAGAVEDQAYTAGTAITALVLPEATGGEGAITYRVFGLPAGLTFDATTRTISGTPEAATEGAIKVSYTAQDGTGATLTLNFSIAVNPPLSFGDLFDLGG